VLVAVDTNVLIDQALENAEVIGALEIIQKRLENVKLIVTPTVLHELAWAVDHSDEQEICDAALRALEHLQEWGYQPLNVIPVGHGIVEQISLKLRMAGILPDEEENDASIIAEAALIGCGILLSADSHLRDAQENPDFRQTLKDCDVDGAALVIARPVTIVEKFFRHA
jgi:predicted nucleic acid-binding protein